MAFLTAVGSTCDTRMIGASEPCQLCSIMPHDGRLTGRLTVDLLHGGGEGNDDRA